MNRKEFFRKLGLASAVAVVAPRVLVDKEENSTPSNESLPKGTLIHTDGSLVEQDEIDDQWKRFQKSNFNMEYKASYITGPYSKEMVINDTISIGGMQYIVVGISKKDKRFVARLIK